MLFHTPEFMFLLTIAFAFYYFLPRLRLYILAAADIIFYAVGGIGYLGLFLFIATATYLLSWKLQGEGKKFYLWLAIGLNVGNLVFFKYNVFYSD